MQQKPPDELGCRQSHGFAAIGILFDALILVALFIIVIGDGFLAVGGSGPQFFATAVLFGMGMGVCIPPLNALI